VYKLFRVNMLDPDDRNAWFLVVEIFWAGILSAAAAFGSTYAIRLGATNFQIGLLSSIPASLAVLVSIPSGRFLQARLNRKPWILGAITLQRGGYMLIALVPWLPVSPALQATLVIAILVLMNVPAHFFNVGFIPFLADAIPENRRASVFASRNIIANVTLSLGTLLYGQWLKRLDFPSNYQFMFLSSLVASLLSLYHLNKVQVPASTPAPSHGNLFKMYVEEWKTMRQAFNQEPAFARITTNTFLHSFGLWAAAPLYILYFVKTMNASDAWIGMLGTVASLGTILGYLLFRRLMPRWGESKTLMRTIVCLGLYPVLVGVLPNLTLMLFAAGLNGLLASGVNLSHLNTLLKAIPADRRPRFTALYISFVNVGAFICPLLGVALADRLGLAPTLIACGLCSIIGSHSFRFWPVWSRQRMMEESRINL
jgi:MFS family permease